MIGVLEAILVFDLPVCMLVLIEWLRTGEPPELSLLPLYASRQERDFHRTLRSRRKLNDEEFYDAFYAGSGIPRHLPGALRKMLDDALGIDFGALEPSDNLLNANEEVDWADVFWGIEKEFQIVIPPERQEAFDGTFDALLQCIVSGRASEGK